MEMNDRFINRLSFYGRLSDDLTREVIPFRSYDVSIKGFSNEPLYKEDGYFVFPDIKPSDSDYELNLTSEYYQSRTIRGFLPSESPVQLTYHGEDELYVVVNQVQGNKKTVTFDEIPHYIKKISKGSQVIGEDGFSSTLAEDIEGKEVRLAILDSINGLRPNEILRFIRSNNIIMRPGPYYSFGKESTLLSLKCIEDDPDETPIKEIKVEIIKVNDKSIDTTRVDSLNIKTVTLTGNKLILGSAKDITTYSDSRGYCIFYYPSDTPITRLDIKLTKSGYAEVNETVTLASQQRTSKTIKLARA